MSQKLGRRRVCDCCSVEWECVFHIIAANILVALIVLGCVLMGVGSGNVAQTQPPTTLALFGNGLFVAGFVFIMLVPLAIMNWIAWGCWLSDGATSEPVWWFNILAPNVILALAIIGGPLMGIAVDNYMAPSPAVLFADGMFVTGFVFVLLVPIAIVNWIAWGSYLCCCS